MQFQPSKRKKKENKDFDNNFQFLSDISDYNKDTWNDLSKYIKRKAKTKLDDKIKRIKRGSEHEAQVFYIISYNYSNGKCNNYHCVLFFQDEIDSETNVYLPEIKKEDSELSLSEDELKKGNNTSLNFMMQNYKYVLFQIYLRLKKKKVKKKRSLKKMTKKQSILKSIQIQNLMQHFIK